MCSRAKVSERLLVLFGTGLTMSILGGFGLSRLYHGEIAVAVTDLIMTASLSVLFYEALRYKKFAYTNALLVLTYSIGLFVLLHLKGIAISYWVYTALAGTFFLLNTRNAVIVNVITIIVSMMILTPYLSTYQFINIGASSVLFCMFGYSFSARASLHSQELSLLATQDPLTKVGNRRSFDERMKEEVVSFNDEPQPCSIMILDLDHFKRVNDEYGHAAGDDVLVDFTNILKSSTRLSDVIYRYGGEEFVIISNNMTLDGAGRFADYLRDLVSQQLKIEDRSITVSIGVSQITEGDSEESWFHRADLALYEAKNTNRNQVFLASKNSEEQTYSYLLYQKESDEVYTNVTPLLPVDRHQSTSA